LWGIFQDILKYAVIKLLHNNGDRCDDSKNRPVSLVTSLSKTFEMVTQTRALKHLSKYNIINF
jgi:hypothetical protein